VPYLNAIPLTFGLEQSLTFLPPSQLAVALHSGRLDVALLSVSEALRHDGYDLLRGPGIVSRGPVYSVGVAHRVPLAEVEEIHIDPATCTSVNLLRVLLATYGWHPRLVPLTDYSRAARHTATLLIGNPAIEFRRAGHPHAWWDLGEAWQETEGLPFVYAAWVLRRGLELREVRALLQRTAREGTARLPELIAQRPEFDHAFRQAYLGGWIQFDLDGPAQLGVERFANRLQALGPDPIFSPRWVD
jgi:chorismate dehydratase